MKRCRRALILLPIGLVLAGAGRLQAADAAPPASEKKAEPAAEEGPSLPADVLNFHGKVTGTVESVDVQKVEFKVKVATAVADPEKNKAPKPESLAGMTITVTPLAKKAVLDAAAASYIKGAKAGDPVTLNVRASSKGVVFRLLNVPKSGGK